MKQLLLWIALLLPGVASANPTSMQPHSLGQNLIFDSPDATQSLHVTFWQPETQPGTHLPLLVVLDGQRYFAHATSLHHLMTDYGWAPPFAVLGVKFEHRRWPTLMGRRSEILAVLANQVFPYLEKHHAVSQERILFGWEAAGGFVLRTLTDAPALFSGYIASSPSPLHGDYFPIYQEDHQKMLATMSDPSLAKHLYVAQGRHDYPQYLGIQTLMDGLTQRASPGLRWQFETIEDASHASLGFETLQRGLRNYYYYFDKPHFDSFADFLSRGGHTFLDTYFARQAKQYGLNEEEVATNRFEALRKLSFVVLMEGKTEAFQQFLTSLQNTDFLARSHLNHIYKYAEFLLEKQDHQRALALFNYLHERHPEHARPIFGQGLVAQAKRQREQAKILLSQAIEVAKRNQDFRLPEYQDALTKFDFASDEKN